MLSLPTTGAETHRTPVVWRKVTVDIFLTLAQNYFLSYECISFLALEPSNSFLYFHFSLCCCKIQDKQPRLSTSFYRWRNGAAEVTYPRPLVMVGNRGGFRMQVLWFQLFLYVLIAPDPLILEAAAVLWKPLLHFHGSHASCTLLAAKDWAQQGALGRPIPGTHRTHLTADFGSWTPGQLGTLLSSLFPSGIRPALQTDGSPCLSHLPPIFSHFLKNPYTFHPVLASLRGTELTQESCLCVDLTARWFYQGPWVP